MNTRTLLALPTLASLILAGCGKEDSPQPPSNTADASKAKTQQAVLPHIPQATLPAASQADGQPMRQTRQRILDEIVQLIGNPTAGLSPEHWRTIKTRYWMPSFDRIVQQGAKPSLVRDLLAVPKGKDSLISQILSGRFTDVDDKAEQDSLIAFHTLALVTAASGGASLPAALEDRMGDANITRGDVILFEVMTDAFVDMPERESAAQVDLNQWKSLTASPNGLHRLLALQTFRRVASKPEQWLEFYRSYLSETDQSIMEVVADLAFQTARPEAAILLGEIRSKSGVAMPADFVAKLDRSIDFLRKLPTRDQ